MCIRDSVDGPNMGVQVLPLCLDTSYRTVHLDIVELEMCIRDSVDTETGEITRIENKPGQALPDSAATSAGEPTLSLIHI